MQEILISLNFSEVIKPTKIHTAKIRVMFKVYPMFLMPGNVN